MCNLSPKQIVREDEKVNRCNCGNPTYKGLEKPCEGKADRYCPICNLHFCSPCATQFGTKLNILHCHPKPGLLELYHPTVPA